MKLKEEILKIAKEAKRSAGIIAQLSSSVKDSVLKEVANKLLSMKDQIITENNKDVEMAKRKGLTNALIDRLTLNEKRIQGMVSSLLEVVKLPDPVGEIVKMWKRPNGLLVGRMRVPLGVIGIIYEARPNVTVEAASLCLKSGNAVILRGGSEAFNTNSLLVKIMQQACEAYSVPKECIQMIPTTDRRAVKELLKLDTFIDLIIPRGGPELINLVTKNSTIPVIKHYKGVCHVYVDDEADLKMAEEIAFNAKVQRPSVCNAMENLLVHEKIAVPFLGQLLPRLAKANVEIRGCPKTRKIYPQAKKATELDWDTEYSDLILAVKIVKDIDEAISFISIHGSKHSDAIVTQNYQKAWKFIREVDSSAVFVNASTRFNDGYELGLGAEIGISTDKLHARGPMGLEELTCTKFIVFGNGQIRE